MTEKSYKDLSDVSIYNLDPERVKTLLAVWRECVLVWSNKDGHPLGVTHAFVYKDGAFWMCCEVHRPRVKAIQRDPRTAVIVSSAGSEMGRGKTITYKGTTEVITGDHDLNIWFLTEHARWSWPEDPEMAELQVRAGDNPGRCILKFTPEKMINSFDGDKLTSR